MAIKELKKPTKPAIAPIEKKVEEFISGGGTVPARAQSEPSGDHRLTLRIPKWLLAKIDVKRKKRLGAISRTQYILEIIDRATRDLS